MHKSFEEEFNEIFGECHHISEHHQVLCDIKKELLLLVEGEFVKKKNSPKSLDEWPTLDDIKSVTFN